MFCTNCGHKIEKNALYCSNCGIKIKSSHNLTNFCKLFNFVKNYRKKYLIIIIILILIISFIFLQLFKHNKNNTFPNLLNYSEEKAISTLISMDYKFEIFPEELSSQSMRDSWFEKFDINIPNSSKFIRFYNLNNSIHTILLVINDGKVIAWYGQFDDDKNGQYLDNLLNLLDIKLKNPSEHYWLGTDLDGSFYSLDDSYVRIVQNEKNYRIQFGVIRHDKKDWIIDFLCEDKELYSEVGLTTQCPFSKEEFENLYKRNNWYDNGVFSSYINIDYPNCDWEYIGTTSDNLFPNPYSYNGYDVYRIIKNNKTFLFVVPYSEYSAVPLVYSYDGNKHTITLIFNNGEIIK